MLLLVPASPYNLRSLIQLIWSKIFQDLDFFFDAENATFCNWIIRGVLLNNAPFDSVSFVFSLNSPHFLGEFGFFFVFFVVKGL